MTGMLLALQLVVRSVDDFSDVSPPAAWIAILAGALFFLGSCVGSFMNVVVYRLPRGESLVHPGSRCPRCGHAIRWYHNIPVFGWLWLRGKCRDCRAPISARYPLVEGLVGAMFLAVGWAQFFPALLRSPAASPFGAILMAGSVLVLCTLLSAGLIEYDGLRPPAKLFVPMFLCGLVVTYARIRLRHGLPADEVFSPEYLSSLPSMIDVFFALPLAMVIGFPLRDGVLLGSLAVIGSVLGLKALLVVFILACVGRLVSLAIPRLRPLARGWGLWLTATTLAWIILWPRLAEHVAGHGILLWR